ncbi:glycosyltransferase [Aminipila butyrica]|uniref:Glycosyltransferase n=1 Tax=Aminipila butyrica TaxID=433296 RepID=A0A858BXJ1_9FIRM|nr:glycosyltransferase [Aminipila butyrica]QIB69610.1 glycosyltransferase [Aminipila butyrica]
MNKYKISVYAISKNEEDFVDRWMDAVSEADEVIVLDTGSTDNTVEKLRSRGAKVYEEKIAPWRFDVARNRAMEKVASDADICVSNDIDEVFESGWRKKLEDAWKREHTRAKYMFVWSHNEDNSINKQFPMEKIHRRHGFKWIHPVHEILQYSGLDKEASVWVPGLILHHYPDNTKPRSQYLPLLELSVEEDPTNDRATFWLGREYMYYKKYRESIETLKKHLLLPSATWKEERSASMRFIARCYDELKVETEAISWLFRSIAECPDIREPYLALARLGYKQQNWPLVYAMVQRALAITNSTGSYLTEPESWGYSLYDLGAISTYHLGLLADSKRYAAKALSLSPHDERLKNNLALIEKKIMMLDKEDV